MKDWSLLLLPRGHCEGREGGWEKGIRATGCLLLATETEGIIQLDTFRILYDPPSPPWVRKIREKKSRERERRKESRISDDRSIQSSPLREEKRNNLTTISGSDYLRPGSFWEERRLSREKCAVIIRKIYHRAPLGRARDTRGKGKS